MLFGESPEFQCKASAIAIPVIMPSKRNESASLRQMTHDRVAGSSRKRFA
jgi:hypothetical protein